MKRILLMGLLFALAGCGVSEPSNEKIAQEMVRVFSRKTGVPSARLKARAKKTGKGRWAVSMEGERYEGARRTFYATAIIDKNGDLHYFFD